MENFLILRIWVSSAWWISLTWERWRSTVLDFALLLLALSEVWNYGSIQVTQDITQNGELDLFLIIHILTSSISVASSCLCMSSNWEVKKKIECANEEGCAMCKWNNCCAKNTACEVPWYTMTFTSMAIRRSRSQLAYIKSTCRRNKSTEDPRVEGHFNFLRILSLSGERILREEMMRLCAYDWWSFDGQGLRWKASDPLSMYLYLLLLPFNTVPGDRRLYQDRQTDSVGI